MTSGAVPATPLREDGAASGSSHVFDRLGVRTVLNANEVMRSILGGTRIHPEAAAAMAQASERFVYIPELLEAVGRRLALLTRNEAAAVTNGAQAGIMLAVAACMAREDAALARLLPDPSRIKQNEVLIHRSHYTPYANNVRQFGAKVVEFGLPYHRTGIRDLEDVISPTTAAVLYTAGREFERHSPALDEVIGVANNAGIPVIVDGSMQVPPAVNLWSYTERGAALAVYSGGKGIRGPQDTGLVVGRSGLIGSITEMLSPNLAIGRSMKSSKEDVVGLYAAVEALLREDPRHAVADLRRRATALSAALNEIPPLRSWVLDDNRQGQPYPRVIAQLRSGSPRDRAALMDELQRGDPAIDVAHFFGADDAFTISPTFLTDSEMEIVVARISGLLRSGAGNPAGQDAL